MLLAEMMGPCMHGGMVWKKKVGPCMHGGMVLEEMVGPCMHGMWGRCFIRVAEARLLVVP